MIQTFITRKNRAGEQTLIIIDHTTREYTPRITARIKGKDARNGGRILIDIIDAERMIKQLDEAGYTVTINLF